MTSEDDSDRPDTQDDADDPEVLRLRGGATQGENEESHDGDGGVKSSTTGLAAAGALGVTN